MSDWNWNGEDEKEDTIIPRVDAIAVYSNVHKDVVIRQQEGMGEDDSIIVIPRIHVQAVVDALLKQMQSE